ncbi:MAG: PAS domain S-box protein, partial [Chloroflexia bacterium]
MARTTRGESHVSPTTNNHINESYRDMVDAMGGIIWELDANTLRYIFVSRGAERLLGYPAEQWIDEPEFWLDHVHPEDRERALKTRIEAIRNAQAHDSEYRMIAADGSVIWFREVVTVKAENDIAVKLHGMQAEKSQRTKELESLKEKEEQYRAIFEATSEGLVINDWDGNVVEVNPGFHKMHGYTHDEMIGMDPRKFVHPEYHEHLANFFALGRKGEQFYTRAMDIRKNGSEFHVEVHGVPFLYNGKPHILGILRDITEQVEAEEMLRLK